MIFYHHSSTIHLGKLSYFTHLNSWAIKGDDSPKINHDEPGRLEGRTGFGRTMACTQITAIFSAKSLAKPILNPRKNLGYEKMLMNQYLL